MSRRSFSPMPLGPALAMAEGSDRRAWLLCHLNFNTTGTQKHQATLPPLLLLHERPAPKLGCGGMRRLAAAAQLLGAAACSTTLPAAGGRPLLIVYPHHHPLVVLPKEHSRQRAGAAAGNVTDAAGHRCCMSRRLLNCAAGASASLSTSARTPGLPQRSRFLMAAKQVRSRAGGQGAQKNLGREGGSIS